MSIISLLLLLSCISILELGYGYSNCITRITMDNVQLQFHTDNQESFERDLNHFCSIHNIYKHDCERIRVRHVEQCSEFQDTFTIATTEHTTELATEQSEAVRSKENASILKEHIGTVDYSQVHGPSLSIHVTDTQENFILQSYVGEAPIESVNRFCSMSGLNGENCKKVENSFIKLHQQATTPPAHKPADAALSHVDYTTPVPEQHPESDASPLHTHIPGHDEYMHESLSHTDAAYLYDHPTGYHEAADDADEVAFDQKKRPELPSLSPSFKSSEFLPHTSDLSEPKDALSDSVESDDDEITSLNHTHTSIITCIMVIIIFFLIISIITISSNMGPKPKMY